MILYDGISAVEHITYNLSDLTLLLHTAGVPYRLLSDETNALVKKGVQNASGVVGATQSLTQHQMNTLHSKVQAGKSVTVLVGAASTVLSMIPAMYKLADSRLGCVMHVVAGGVNKDRSYDLDYSDVFAARHTGFAFLSSHTVAECQDMAVLAQVASKLFSTPFLHFFDSAYAKADVKLLTKVELQGIIKEFGLDSHDGSGDHQDTDEAVVSTYLRSGTYVNSDEFQKLPEKLDGVMERLAKLFGRRYQCFEYTGPAEPTHLVVALGSAADVLESELSNTHGKAGVLKIRLYRPWSLSHFLAAIPSGTERITVLEHVVAGEGDDLPEWGPLFLDVVNNVQQWPKSRGDKRPTVKSAFFHESSLSVRVASEILSSVSAGLSAESQSKTLAPAKTVAVSASVPPHLRPEAKYIKMLKQTFGDRLNISNAVGAMSVWGSDDSHDHTTSEDSEYTHVLFGLGVLLGHLSRRSQLVNTVSDLVTDEKTEPKLAKLMTEWLATRDDPRASSNIAAVAPKAIQLAASAAPSPNLTALRVATEAGLLTKQSHWLIGGTDWAYDLSLSGIHHVISSKQNVNLLVVETEPYSGKATQARRERWKKDIGLYAMTYGGVYVASVALYSSYTQVLQAMVEADAFPGPSIVLAYAPQPTAESKANDAYTTAVEMLKETKAAVATGKWPLYRWNPAAQEEQGHEKRFTLDSTFAKRELEAFLARENQLSILAKEVPVINKALSSALHTDVLATHEAKQTEAVDSYLQLLAGLKNSAPLLVLYGSDGGNAEAVARRLTAEAVSRSLDARALAMDDVSVPELADEENVVFVVSTAGQGEFPSNAKNFWKSLVADSGPGMLTSTKFAVFAMGDRLYWPRPEELHFFAKPGKDLDTKMADIGGERMVDVGLGDDQDDDGYESALAEWEPRLWEALGVAGMGGGGGSKAVKINDDELKEGSNFLRGTILEGLADDSTGALAEKDTKLTKFHGIYQQDDRDLREARREEGLEKAFSFMIRVGIPGGICNAQQYLTMDDLGTRQGNGGLKLTTRQAFQLHGVIKSNLKDTMREIIQGTMDTLAACGDVCRNVMASCFPDVAASVHEEIHAFTREISDHLKPRTSAYHEIWLDKKQVAGYVDKEPLYGDSYLPRKFKVAIAVPPYNDVDVFAHCLGYIAIVQDDKLLGWNVTVGGGMGMTHNNAKTYPCIGQLMGFCTPEQAVKVGETVMLIQRDHGDRQNRKHARLKYTLEDLGMEWFKNEVERRCGFKLQEGRPYEFTSNADRLGWNRSADGNWVYGMFVENGRIKDTADFPMKTGLREVAKVHKGDFRLTANGNMYIGGISEASRPEIEVLLAKYKLVNELHTGLRLNSMACASLPYCGLAFAESERYLPSLISKMETAVEEAGLHSDAITMRMTGCANGCARPYIAEIGFVGRAPGIYNLYLGAGHSGERLSKLYRSGVNEEQILELVRPMFSLYATERQENEWFGDFVIRKGIVKETKAGPDFHKDC